MPPQALFGISVLFSFVASGIVMQRYVWPVLRTRERNAALRPILSFHSFRFVGLAFLIPGVVSPSLPAAFAWPAAYGDLATAVLALIAGATLHTRFGVVLVWGFNPFGTVDLLNAFYEGNHSGLGLDPSFKAPRTSFRHSWCHCFSSRTVSHSGCCCGVKLGSSRIAAGARHDGHYALASGGVDWALA